MTLRLSASILIGLLAAACSSDSGTDTPASGGAGSPPTTGGVGTAGGGQASQSGQAGQAPSTGGNAAGTPGASGMGGASAGQGGSSSGAAGTPSTGGGGAGGGGPHAGDGCVPGGSGFDTSIADVVIDKKTCLVWERKDPVRDMSSCALQRGDIPSALCWTAAQAYCDALMLDDLSDWRLPTVAELQTIIASPPPSGPIVPTIDHDAFPDAVANLYWSSESSSGKVHCADFNGGPPTNNTGPDGPQAFRCVRASTP